MKKTFKFIISAIICLALLIVPMTVMAEEGIDYNINYETYLTEGTNSYPIDSTVPYTVYILYPSEVGDYTITSSDCVMGIVSYFDMWVQTEPTEENVNLNEIVWTCTDINQSIMVAVKTTLSDVDITVSYKASDNSDEIPIFTYENTKTPEKFEMPDFVNLDAFEDGYVDFEDDKIDNAVLGDDGYYHLNDKNGSVLFINLNDSIMSLYSMVGYGKLAAVSYDTNGKATKIVDYTDAFFEYVDALPTDSNGTITMYYYPLTADLIEMFKEIGTSHEWYSGSTWVYESDDAWMFACYFDEEVTSMDRSNDNNNDDGANDNNDSNTPSTDDKNDTTDDKSEDKTDDNSENKTDDKSDNKTDDKSEDKTDDKNTTPNTNTSNNENTDTSKKSPDTGSSIATITLALISASVLALTSKKKI